MAQQVERRTCIPEVRVQILLKSAFFSFFRQCHKRQNASILMNRHSPVLLARSIKIFVQKVTFTSVDTQPYAQRAFYSAKRRTLLRL